MRLRQRKTELRRKSNCWEMVEGTNKLEEGRKKALKTKPELPAKTEIGKERKYNVENDLRHKQ